MTPCINQLLAYLGEGASSFSGKQRCHFHGDVSPQGPSASKLGPITCLVEEENCMGEDAAWPSVTICVSLE